MTQQGRIRASPVRSRAAWVAVLLSVLAIALAAVLLPGSRQNSIAPFALLDAQVLWIHAAPTGLPRFPSENEATHRTSELPFGDASPVQLYHRFNLPAPPDAPMAVFLPEVDGQTRLFANGAEMKEAFVPRALGMVMPSSGSRIWIIPTANLHAGENRIDMIVSDSKLRALTGPVYLGPAATLKPFALSAASLLTAFRTLVLIIATLGVVTCLAAVAVRAHPVYLTGAALCAAVATRILIANQAALPSTLTPITDQMVVLATLLCIAAAARASADTASVAGHQLSLALIMATMIAGAASLVAVAIGSTNAVHIAIVALWIALAGVVWTIGLLTSSVFDFDHRQQMTIGIVAGCGGVALGLMLVGATGIGLQLPSMTAESAYGLSIATLALIVVGQAAMATARKVRGYLNDRLDQHSIITAQKAALDSTTRALDQRNKETAILEERHRMARDVHDGIGGQLASLIAQVRLRRVSMDHVEQALVGGLSELRLLVDSLDLVGETLSDALASLLVRIRGQTSAAAIKLEWNQDPNLAFKVADPHWILNIYRLTQEAITNAIRHSGGDIIGVSITRNDGRSLTLLVEDNGRSFSAASTSVGRGLANMTHRTKELGGTIEFGRSAQLGGAMVRVDLPIPA